MFHEIDPLADISDMREELDTLRALLRRMANECPVCRGTGEVKKWEAVDPKTKYPTGRYVGMRPCPYCSKARKVMGMEENK